MYLYLVLIALSVAFLSGVAGLFFYKKTNIGQIISLILMSISGVIGLYSSFQGIFQPSFLLTTAFWKSAGVVILGIDKLGSFFLVLIFLIGTMGALYGVGYWKQSEHSRNARRLQLFWGFLVSGMALLVIGRHAFSFLLGWEIMALSAFFLISTEDEKEECRKSALVYLISTHICTLSIFGLFVFWRNVTGSFSLFPLREGQINQFTNNMLFFIIFFSFGLKAGIIPLHFWLPGAHANAPSHVSAILSGVMIKMGIYGILRMTLLLQNPPAIWGITVLIFGLVSGLLGVVFAIAQHDIKRLLAYHSIENIGIILMGFGIALLGKTFQKPEWFALGMAGCLLHVWNHGIFKPLLFFGAGSVLHATGTRDIEALGGLTKKMPATSLLFFIGSVAICGLPPLNGFISEFFIYNGFLKIITDNISHIGVVAVGVAVLAAIGALATACFVKVISIVFLGAPRNPKYSNAHESSFTMIIPMVLLGALCFLIGVFPIIISPVIDSIIGKPFLTDILPVKMLSIVSIILFTAILLFIVLFIVLFLILTKRARKSITWDCGYAKPDNRMQYSASSFAGSITNSFNWALHSHEKKPNIKVFFPQRKTNYISHVNELVLDRLILPFYKKMKSFFFFFNRFQQGQIQYYVLYIAITVIILMITLVPFKDLINEIFNK